MDYSKTYFYKIVSKDPNHSPMYIGHTTNFNKRLWRHKGCCSNEKNTHHNLELYKHIRDNGGWGNWQMILIETKKCEDNLEARKYERELIEQLKPSINILRPFASEEEHKERRKSYYFTNLETIKPKRQIYRDGRKEEKSKTDKEYRENNKEKLKVKHQEYYEQNKESIKAKVKEYAENNKEKRKERDIRYRENNKELIQQKKKDYREKNSNIIICDCGKSFKKYNLWCHNKSKKHQDYINSLQN